MRACTRPTSPPSSTRTASPYARATTARSAPRTPTSSVYTPGHLIPRRRSAAARYVYVRVCVRARARTRVCPCP
eukprot:3859085-Prymnesium_polylepis.1